MYHIALRPICTTPPIRNLKNDTPPHKRNDTIEKAINKSIIVMQYEQVNF